MHGEGENRECAQVGGDPASALRPALSGTDGIVRSCYLPRSLLRLRFAFIMRELLLSIQELRRTYVLFIFRLFLFASAPQAIPNGTGDLGCRDGLIFPLGYLALRERAPSDHGVSVDAFTTRGWRRILA